MCVACYGDDECRAGRHDWNSNQEMPDGSPARLCETCGFREALTRRVPPPTPDDGKDTPGA